MKRLVKLAQKKNSRKKPSSRDDLLSGVDYVLLSGGGSLMGDFSVRRPSSEHMTPKSSPSTANTKKQSYA